MKFKVDENLPIDVAARLRAAHYDASTVHEQQLGGKPDWRISEVCREEDRVLLTLDLDFANVRAYPPRDYAGIIVLRLSRQDKRHVLNTLERVLALLMQEIVYRRLWIVEETRIRIWGEDID